MARLALTDAKLALYSLKFKQLYSLTEGLAMKKGNVIDFNRYQKQRTGYESGQNDADISEELKKAIQSLIHRLREKGPLKQSS